MQNLQHSWNIAVTITLLGTITIALLGYIINKAIADYNRESLKLRLQYENLKSMQEKMILESEVEIREQTFQYISKEIHDNITQTLSLAQLSLNCIEHNSEQSEKQAQRCKEQLSKALLDLNSLSKSLDSDIIESHGLIEAVKFEIKRWQRLFDNQLELNIDGEPIELKQNTELFIFRIIQESISNTLKHSKAKHTQIGVSYKENSLVIEITDDGIGFDWKMIHNNKETGKMSGLKNMKKRAEFIGGSFNVTSDPGKGTTVKVEIPF